MPDPQTALFARDYQTTIALSLAYWRMGADG